METKNNKKIIHFTHWTRNGISSLIKSLIVNSCNHEDTFLLLDSDDDFEGYYSDIRSKYQLSFSANKVKALWMAFKILRAIKADIVHAHSFTPFIIAALFSSNSRVIFHLHSEYPYLYQTGLKLKLKRLAIYLVTRIKPVTFFAVTERAANLAENITGINCQYIPNAIPDSGTVRASFNDAPCRNRFYSVGRLDSQKNVGYAIALFKELLSQGFDLSYAIYGSGHEAANLQAMIDSSQLHDRISLKGFTNTPESLPGSYDFFLSTSKQEGLSLSALHGMRGKTPVITTPVGQIGNILSHGINGFFLSGNFHNDLDILKQVIATSSMQLSSIQENARTIYLTQFTEKILIARIFSEYARLQSKPFETT